MLSANYSLINEMRSGNDFHRYSLSCSSKRLSKMKKKLLPAFLLFFAVTAVYSQSGLCDTFYWNHTYSPFRLQIYDSCVTITATMSAVIIPPCVSCSGIIIPGTGDGDYHIYIYPDSAYTWMTTYRDTNYTKLCVGTDSIGYLVCPTCLNVEEICHGLITDGGASGDTEMTACATFTDTLYVPNQGEHLMVTGPFIYDIEHCWNEIHPVSKMVVIAPAGISAPPGNVTDGLKLYPVPANKQVTFQFAHAPHAVTLVKFYTMEGKQFLAYGLCETSQLNVDVSSWPAGQYLYSIISQEQGATLKSGAFSVVH
jgi:hypothetical protein